MSKKRLFWIVFYTFPIIGNIILFLIIYAEAGNNFHPENNFEVDNYKCVCYSRYDDDMDEYKYIYVLEKTYPKEYSKCIRNSNRDLFFVYSVPPIGFDLSVDISYNEEQKELIVRHYLPNKCIVLQKNKIHGIKVSYVLKYAEESINEQ